MSDADHSTEIQNCVNRLQAGDRSALDDLLNRATLRLGRLARKMLADFPGVHRWEETDDVLQNATLRLCRALEQVHPPTVADSFRLAAVQIRRELIDLSRHYFGAEGIGVHHASLGAAGQGVGGAGDGSFDAPAAGVHPSDVTHDPQCLAAWTEFHVQAEALPPEEREPFELLYYQGLTQEEAAAILGVSGRTIKRRWTAARLRLAESLGGRMPGL